MPNLLHGSMFEPLTSEMADHFRPTSVPAPAGRERQSAFRDWIALTKPAPQASRRDGLPALRAPDRHAPTDRDLADSGDRLAKRYGRRVTLADLLEQRKHQLSNKLLAEPQACIHAAVEARIVGATPVQIAHDFAVKIDLRWHSGSSWRSKTAERLIQRGDHHQWHLGVWPWAGMDSPNVPNRWEWWTDPRCLDAFRIWWAQGWIETLDLEATLRGERSRAFGCSLEELGWATPEPGAHPA